jgi:hypothetical protein
VCAGVANPVFESHNEWWDILCDVDSGTIKLPTPKQASMPPKPPPSLPPPPPPPPAAAAQNSDALACNVAIPDAPLSSPALTRGQGSRSGEVSPELLAELQVDCESRLIAQAHNRCGV